MSLQREKSPARSGGTCLHIFCTSNKYSELSSPRFGNLPMLLKQRNPAFILVALILALSSSSIERSEALSSGHASHAASGGHATPSKSTSPSHHYGGRGHYRRYPGYGDYSEEESLPPVSNQFDVYTRQQDAKRAALPRSAFVQEYQWPTTQTSPDTRTALRTQDYTPTPAPAPEGARAEELVIGAVKARVNH
jgi:hypothetical protein